eukprot:CAMPEP_0194226466 /NCGR_PEP_ID=MMETSP0156-20130528/41915_1 /TAXON_ID=33649 /ORGANISM="Thalassionema nitzschioides, Strain L26-B" /LENGTH=739 /DNA_ID=CAMNT_0038958825 /DNA_START=23 /DNA_END=2242 /DNA_ORIENTATION=+
MKRGSDGEHRGSGGENPIIPLCASCDRCRARKTRCDGQRPCGNCATKYMKKNKVSSIEGINLSEFGCVYSPAKRRGPVPGRNAQSRKPSGVQMSQEDGVCINVMDPIEQASSLLQRQGSLTSGRGQYEESDIAQLLLQRQGLGFGPLALGGLTSADHAILASGEGIIGDAAGDASSKLKQFNYLQQFGPLGGSKPMTGIPTKEELKVGQDHVSAFSMNRETIREDKAPDTVTAHLSLLGTDSTMGNRLRALYQLSVDELFMLPPIRTESLHSSDEISKSHTSALAAAQFAELALGATVHHEIPLSLELSNATVYCLCECIKESVPRDYIFEVIRSIFLLGCFYMFRGDMVRYFKYRHACIKYLTKYDHVEGAEALLAAMAYLDAWQYMIHNANEKKLPEIGTSFEPGDCPSPPTFGCAASAIASDPKNRMWIQGSPPIYLSLTSPLPARSLDALAFAIRSCCDNANGRFAQMSKEADPALVDEITEEIPDESILTETKKELSEQEDEFCSRNMVLSSFKLLREYEMSTGSTKQNNQGHHLIISAMDAFLDDGEEDHGFTDNQVQSLINVCNIAIENPLLLYHAGPTYHMVSNAAILLCHLMNGMHAMNASTSNGTSREMEAVVFEEVLDTFLSIRKLLHVHRRKLPSKLRCHSLPRPSMQGPKEGELFVDLNTTILCGCRGCQGFVLMACSPCVAAERARSAAQKREIEAMRESETVDNDWNNYQYDDEALLNALSDIF